MSLAKNVLPAVIIQNCALFILGLVGDESETRSEERGGVRALCVSGVFWNVSVKVYSFGDFMQRVKQDIDYGM